MFIRGVLRTTDGASHWRPFTPTSPVWQGGQACPFLLLSDEIVQAERS